MSRVQEVDTLSVMTSPSGSYLALDVAQLPPTLPCRGTVQLPLLTTLPDSMPPVQLQVRGGGRA